MTKVIIGRNTTTTPNVFSLSQGIFMSQKRETTVKWPYNHRITCVTIIKFNMLVKLEWDEGKKSKYSCLYKW